MKLKEWIELNEDLHQGDLIVLALKSGSWKKDDQIFRVNLRQDYAKVLFGEYEIKRFRTGQYPNSEVYGTEVLIWINIDEAPK